MVHGAIDGARCHRWCTVPSMVQGAIGGAECHRWCTVQSMVQGAIDGAGCHRWCKMPSMVQYTECHTRIMTSSTSRSPSCAYNAEKYPTRRGGYVRMCWVQHPQPQRVQLDDGRVGDHNKIQSPTFPTGRIRPWQDHSPEARRMIGGSSPAVSSRSERRIDGHHDQPENALHQRPQQRPLNSGCIGRPCSWIDSRR